MVVVVHAVMVRGVLLAVALAPAEWTAAILVASTTLLLDELRKLILRLGAPTPEEER